MPKQAKDEKIVYVVEKEQSPTNIIAPFMMMFMGAVFAFLSKGEGILFYGALTMYFGLSLPLLWYKKDDYALVKMIMWAVYLTGTVGVYLATVFFSDDEIIHYLFG